MIELKVNYAFNVAWAIFFGMVSVIYGHAAIKSAISNDFSDRFFLISGIAISFFAGFMSSTYYSYFWYMRVNDIYLVWMTTHYINLLFATIAVVGGILHIRAATKAVYGERLWLLCCLFVSCIMLYIIN